MILWSAVAKDRLIVEVPRRLPSAANSLDVIGPCNALDERVVSFVLLGRVVAELAEYLLSLLEGGRILLLKDVIGPLGSHEVSLAVPGGHLSNLSQRKDS